MPNKKIAANKTKKVTKRPKITEAIISPKIMAHKQTGEETNLSKVFILVSQGAITGVIAETAKKIAIPKSPESKNVKGTSLLKEKEMNKKAGISNP